MKSIDQRALALHARAHGKISIHPKFAVKNNTALSEVYTPGVAAVSRAIAARPSAVWDYTIRRNMVAVVTDGSAVLGLGNIGPAAALPVMEGKAMLFKERAGIDAFPLCLATQDPDEIVATVRRIAPVFGGINLEDIAAPKCFAIEAQLQDLGIPVLHDDQHATAIVVQAALQNASRVVGKKIEHLRVVVNGAGAAGVSAVKMLQCLEIDRRMCTSVADIVVCDRTGIIDRNRPDLPPHKQDLATHTNRRNRSGGLAEALKDADVFIGLSTANTLTPDLIKVMADDPIIFALANPVPEIMPPAALRAGAAIVGTGRSDFPNQINNVLAFPGVFRGALDAGATRFTREMLVAAAHALARSVTPRATKILPHALDRGYVKKVSIAVAKEAKRAGVIRGR